MGHVMGDDDDGDPLRRLQAPSMLRGTEWAATGKVTIPIPDDFPTASQVSVREGRVTIRPGQKRVRTDALSRVSGRGCRGAAGEGHFGSGLGRRARTLIRPYGHLLSLTMREGIRSARAFRRNGPQIPAAVEFNEC